MNPVWISAILLIAGMGTGCVRASAGVVEASPSQKAELKATNSPAAEDQLRNWAGLMMEKEHARVAVLKQAVAGVERRLQQEETHKNHGEAQRMQSDQSDLTAAQISLDVARNTLELCTDVVSRELQIAAYNRKNPAHPLQSISGARKQMCGGPEL